MTNTTTEAIIEIPMGSIYKYEVDKTSNALVLDRVLIHPMVANYGFIPNTLSPDGDPLDIYVVGHQSIPPLTKVKVNLHAVVMCLDTGERDEKLIGVVVGENVAFDINKIVNYLQIYKPGKMKVLGVRDTLEAINILEEAKDRYKESKPKKFWDWD